MISNELVEPELLAAKRWFIEKYTSGLDEPIKEGLKRVILISDYACKHLPLIVELLVHKVPFQLLTRQEYFSAIRQIVLEQSQPSFSAALRRYRHTYFLQLLLLEQSELINTAQAIQAWSDCADAIIVHSVHYCQNIIANRYGRPKDDSGNLVALFTLAMGKLGGRELNYSSDIDLIFAFDKAGTTDGEEQISNQEYFSKVIQLFIQILQNKTADGFVFRVDLRLRPNGDSGALTCSLAAMETYYQEQGRDWERYAMVKARVVEEDLHRKQCWFDQLIIPFVYRRYVDFSVIESLRSMKSMIEREVQLNPRLDDIKRGQGGIREVEFIIQSMQLIRGGRLPQLRAQNALSALAILKKERLLPRCDVLKQAYLYLRQLENVLQSLNDQQTHSLPEDKIKQNQVALAMRHSSWSDLVLKLNQYQRIISYSFRTILGTVTDYEDEQRVLTHQLSSLWHGHVESNMAINLLASLGFTNAEHCYQIVHTFRHGSKCRRLSQAARLRLERLIIVLLSELPHYDNTDKILAQFIHMLENIVGRSAYLALLTENRPVLQELLFWFSASPFIASLLVNHPFLFEVLLASPVDWRPSSRKELEHQLTEQLSHAEEIEVKEDTLRQFKLSHWLMAARAELYGLSTASRVGTFLADVAEVIVAQVVHMASEQLGQRFPEINSIKAGFTVLAYGKLGSREMNYSSDLDLVFLHTAQSTEEALVTRLTQKIVHMLTMRSQAGVLFTVDTRLRPSGSAGLLVSHVDAFIDYQKHQAWTWEHQALLKARVISGKALIKKQFLSLKKTLLTMPRDKKKLQTEVQEMRAKIELHHQKDSIKNFPGGLLDIEFLLQYLLLYLQDNTLARYTHPLSQLKQLLHSKIITKGDYALLKKAYQNYHALLHQQIIATDVSNKIVLNGGSKDRSLTRQLSDDTVHQEIVNLCKRMYSFYS